VVFGPDDAPAELVVDSRLLESREGGVEGVEGARGDMRADSGHRRQRALEERSDDGFHAVRLALGEGPVELREGVQSAVPSTASDETFGWTTQSPPSGKT
jgi:hypothetical protein